MSYNSYNQQAYNQYHQEALLRAAEHERLVQLAQSQQQNRPVYGPVLAAVGKQLVNLGQHLQGESAPNSLAVESQS